MALKIGIVTEYYYPLLGGITESVHNTRIRLEGMGHKVKIITSHYNGNKFAVHENHDLSDPDVVRLGKSFPVYSNGSFGHFTIGFKLRGKIRKILNAEDFDLLHLHSPIVFTLPAFGLLEAKSPTVGTFHTYFDGSFIYSMFRDAIQRQAIDRLDGQIFVSSLCVQALNRYFKLKPRIIPNGVDTSQFNPDVPRYDKFDNRKMNLLFLSRFDPRNGLALMLKAFEIVKCKFPEIRLIIVGDGPLGFYYQQITPRKLKHDIHFEGLAGSQRPKYYASCDIFCSPIMKASFGITLLEAMASGKPIVATENCGYDELFSRDAGFIVPPDDPYEFAEAILRLLKDERLRREMGKKGREYALKYSWDNVVREIFDFYQEILQKR
jgi:phosphatidyl-myo-inositol alpha-mannosyltransferase